MQNRAVTSLESIILVVGCGLWVRLYYTTHNRQPTTHNQHANTEREKKDGL